MTQLRHWASNCEAESGELCGLQQHRPTPPPAHEAQLNRPVGSNPFGSQVPLISFLQAPCDGSFIALLRCLDKSVVGSLSLSRGGHDEPG